MYRNAIRTTRGHHVGLYLRRIRAAYYADLADIAPGVGIPVGADPLTHGVRASSFR